MTHNSTLQNGPSAEMLESIRRFAREFKPEQVKGKTIIMQMGVIRPLDVC